MESPGNTIRVLDEWDDTTGVTVEYDGAHKGEFERDRPALIVLSGLHIGQTFLLSAERRVLVGRDRDVDIRLVDEGVSRKHVVITRAGDGALWLEDLSSRNGTFYNGRQVGRCRLEDGDKIQLGRSTMLRFAYLDEFDVAFHRQMYDSALRDGLTRVFNRRYFSERLDAEVHFAIRHQAPLSLLLLDVDHFKQVNDVYGHLAGDQVLAKLAELLQRNVRNEDVLARYGGEEFAIISRAIPMEAARRFAERLRSVVERLRIEYDGQVIPLTISVGLAALPQVQARSAVDLVRAADMALYRAKSRGRNLVSVYDPRVDQPARRHAGSSGSSSGPRR